jgi:type IX secretion system PorP/SprF family membrane protein
MKKSCLALFAMLCTSGLWAQQDVQFTQFANNKIFYNPGVIGSGDAICLTAVHRSQWVGFDNAPTTQNFSANVPLDVIGGGISVNFSNDVIGYFQDITAGVGYGYQMELAGGSLGLGLRADFRNKNVTLGVWAPPQTMNDPSLVAPGSTSMATDISFGAFYQLVCWFEQHSPTRNQGHSFGQWWCVKCRNTRSASLLFDGRLRHRPSRRLCIAACSYG